MQFINILGSFWIVRAYTILTCMRFLIFLTISLKYSIRATTNKAQTLN